MYILAIGYIIIGILIAMGAHACVILFTNVSRNDHELVVVLYLTTWLLWLVFVVVLVLIGLIQLYELGLFYIKKKL